MMILRFFDFFTAAGLAMIALGACLRLWIGPRYGPNLQITEEKGSLSDLGLLLAAAGMLAISFRIFPS